MQNKNNDTLHLALNKKDTLYVGLNKNKKKVSARENKIKLSVETDLETTKNFKGQSTNIHTRRSDNTLEIKDLKLVIQNNTLEQQIYQNDKSNIVDK